MCQWESEADGAKSNSLILVGQTLFCPLRGCIYNDADQAICREPETSLRIGKETKRSANCDETSRVIVICHSFQVESVNPASFASRV